MPWLQCRTNKAVSSKKKYKKLDKGDIMTKYIPIECYV